jgi:hypothetical protein
MLPGAFINASVALAFLTALATSASAQPVAVRPESAVAVSEPTSGSAPDNATPGTPAQPAPATSAPPKDERYQDGIVIYETPADVKCRSS